MPPTEAEKKAEADRIAQAERAASLEGARSVADAVSKVANAAVAEVQKVKREPAPELVATGVAGGRFAVVGSGFGASGTVLLNGKQVQTNGWSATRIEGLLPADARSGEVVVWVDPDTQRRGYLTL